MSPSRLRAVEDEGSWSLSSSSASCISTLDLTSRTLTFRKLRGCGERHKLEERQERRILSAMAEGNAKDGEHNLNVIVKFL
mmetsp:Transcript_126080/g.218483  ORF Transcript_126080/g.218483 Transcript_126080/m.218483 type:complete len:81 (-) Transcript_126080:52-294(-)